ncbi:MAG: hypothetical protein R3F41_07030 [Gammaproteobacteria bacterium]|nr:hypothetical protein [Pseudomonadales bacterium]
MPADLLYGTEIRRRHSNNFIVGFDRLLNLARDCDTDHIIQDALIYSAHGLLNIRMRSLHPTVKFAPIETTDAAAYLQQIVKVDSEKSALDEVARVAPKPAL